MATIIKCKMCGGDLALVEGSAIATCEFCGSQQTVPVADDEKKLVQFERAERLRKQCEFDKAAGIYETIVADFRQEAEAYWGLVLCKYGIEYVDDPATGRKIPTCHRSSFDSIMEDSDFEQVLENAEPAARKVYREEAKAIEEIRKGIIAVSANEEPYDIFICYKETDEKGERTLDSVLAQDVYDALTDKGYRVFFSRITLEDKLGVEYEPYIFAALNSAKIMLAFGTDYEYFNAVWVKNEWSRFLKLMAKDKSKHLIPCYKGIDAYDMPKEFAKLQAQDLNKMGAIQDIVRNMDKLIERSAKQSVKAATKDGTDEGVMLLYDAKSAIKRKEWEYAKMLLEKAEKAEMSVSDRLLHEQSLKDSKELVEYQLRCLEVKQKNRGWIKILTVALALVLVVGGYFAVRGTEQMFIVIYHIIFTVIPVLMAIKGMGFVPRKKGELSRWGTYSCALCVLGVVLIVSLVIMGQNIIVINLGTFWWLASLAALYVTVLVTLIFRKKA